MGRLPLPLHFQVSHSDSRSRFCQIMPFMVGCRQDCSHPRLSKQQTAGPRIGWTAKIALNITEIWWWNLMKRPFFALLVCICVHPRFSNSSTNPLINSGGSHVFTRAYQLLNAKPENVARETEIVASSGRKYAWSLRSMELRLMGTVSMCFQVKPRVWR